jgi:hypothetical protein
VLLLVLKFHIRVSTLKQLITYDSHVTNNSVANFRFFKFEVENYYAVLNKFRQTYGCYWGWGDHWGEIGWNWCWAWTFVLTVPWTLCACKVSGFELEVFDIPNVWIWTFRECERNACIRIWTISGICCNLSVSCEHPLPSFALLSEGVLRDCWPPHRINPRM